MNQLLRSTTAYAILNGDKRSGRLAHAYLLHFADAACLRHALKFFALSVFGADENSREGRLILSEGFADLKVYPAEGKKPTVADAGEIVEDSALKPLEGDKKLYIFSDFDKAAALVQNKLLKVLEEPPQGVYFLLGATSLSPVLPTVLSRVRQLYIPPFSEDQVLAALNRMGGDPSLNALAAKSCGGIFGQAAAQVTGGWFKEALSAAQKIASCTTLAEAARYSLEYGEIKEKQELLKQVQRLWFSRLKDLSSGDIAVGNLTRPALLYAVDKVNKALGDLNFNASFPNLLYDLLSCVVTENDKWKKLLE